MVICKRPSQNTIVTDVLNTILSVYQSVSYSLELTSYSSSEWRGKESDLASARHCFHIHLKMKEVQ